MYVSLLIATYSYINDLFQSCSVGSEVYVYADDAKLFKHIQTPEDKDVLRKDINNLNNWTKEWLLKLNISKCKSITYRRNILYANRYNIEGIEIENVNHIKDLGVTFDSKLRFDMHIQDKINKANCMLGIIKRNFRYLNKEAFITLYKSLIRAHLENAVAVWKPHFKSDIERMEKVLMRATKIIRNIANLT